MITFLKSKLFLFLISVGSLVAGGQIIYISIKNPKPTTISMSDYLKNKPDIQWVNFTNVRLGLNKSVYSSSKNTNVIKDVYIPVNSAQANSPKTNVFIRTDNADAREMMRLSLLRSRSKQDTAKMRKIALEWIKKTTINGLIQIGIDSDSEIESQIKKLSGLSSIQILELNAKPQHWSLGLALGLFSIGLFVYALKKKTA